MAAGAIPKIAPLIDLISTSPCHPYWWLCQIPYQIPSTLSLWESSGHHSRDVLALLLTSYMISTLHFFHLQNEENGLIIIVDAVVCPHIPSSRPSHSFPQLLGVLAADSSQVAQSHNSSRSVVCIQWLVDEEVWRPSPQPQGEPTLKSNPMGLRCDLCCICITDQFILLPNFYSLHSLIGVDPKGNPQQKFLHTISISVCFLRNRLPQRPFAPDLDWIDSTDLSSQDLFDHPGLSQLEEHSPLHPPPIHSSFTEQTFIVLLLCARPWPQPGYSETCPCLQEWKKSKHLGAEWFLCPFVICWHCSFPGCGTSPSSCSEHDPMGLFNAGHGWWGSSL